MASTRFTLVLIGIFAMIGLVLSSVGLYGVLSQAVRQRTPEIGVRMAFGARPRAILRMVVAEGLRLTAFGAVLGVTAAIWLTQVLASQLVGVQPTDIATFTAVILVFVTVATLACYVPARRATRVDPLVALREE